MKTFKQILKCAVAASAGFLAAAGVGAAQDADLDDLFAALQSADAGTHDAIEAKIWEEWSKSGSPAMDLLLQRGRDALEAGDYPLAISHFTALIDHAPDFAEGYNARATAYFHAQMFGPSIEDIRQVLARNPRHFGALSGLAVMLEDLGIKDGALEAWREVQKLNPLQDGVAETVGRLEKEIEGQTL